MSGHDFAVREQQPQAPEPAPAPALVVGAVHDAAEREADRVAAEVLRRLADADHDLPTDRPHTSLTRGRPVIHRMLKTPAPTPTTTPTPAPPTAQEVAGELSETGKPVDVVKPTLDEFLNSGGRPDSSCMDNGENTTLLHVAALYRREPDLAAYLVSKGADVNVLDPRRRTPLHAAARLGRTETARVLVRSFGADPMAVDQARWTPYDVAVAAGFKECAQYLASEMSTTTVPDPEALPGLAPGPNTTPAILAAATKSMDPAVSAKDLYLMYEELYGYRDLRPILDIAALEAVQSRATDDNALRIFLSDSDNVTPLRQGGGYGSYNDTTSVSKGTTTHKLEGTVTLAGAIPAQKKGGVEVASAARMVLGNMIHELTHHAARKVFGNGAVPIKPGDFKSLELYLAAFREDSIRWLEPNLAPATTAAREVGFEQVEGYQGSLVQPLQEIIVRAPQTLVQYGAVAELALPQEAAYFRTKFLPAAEEFVRKHAQLKNLAPPTDSGKTTFSAVGPGPEGVRLSDLTVERLTSMVTGRITNARRPDDIGATAVDAFLERGIFDPQAIGFAPEQKDQLQGMTQKRGALPARLPPSEVEKRIGHALRKAKPSKLDDRVLPVDEVDQLVAALAAAVTSNDDVRDKMIDLLKATFNRK